MGIQQWYCLVLVTLMFSTGEQLLLKFQIKPNTISFPVAFLNISANIKIMRLVYTYKIEFISHIILSICFFSTCLRVEWVGAGQVSVQQECLVYYRAVCILDPHPLNAHNTPLIMVKTKMKHPTIFKMPLVQPALLWATGPAISGATCHVIIREMAKGASFLPLG